MKRVGIVAFVVIAMFAVVCAAPAPAGADRVCQDPLGCQQCDARGPDAVAGVPNDPWDGQLSMGTARHPGGRQHHRGSGDRNVGRADRGLSDHLWGDSRQCPRGAPDPKGDRLRPHHLATLHACSARGSVGRGRHRPRERHQRSGAPWSHRCRLRGHVTSTPATATPSTLAFTVHDPRLLGGRLRLSAAVGLVPLSGGGLRYRRYRRYLQTVASHQRAGRSAVAQPMATIPGGRLGGPPRHGGHPIPDGGSHVRLVKESRMPTAFSRQPGWGGQVRGPAGGGTTTARDPAPPAGVEPAT